MAQKPDSPAKQPVDRSHGIKLLFTVLLGFGSRSGQPQSAIRRHHNSATVSEELTHLCFHTLDTACPIRRHPRFRAGFCTLQSPWWTLLPDYCSRTNSLYSSVSKIWSRWSGHSREQVELCPDSSRNGMCNRCTYWQIDDRGGSINVGWTIKSVLRLLPQRSGTDLVFSI
jgi:hypothetical protein